MSDQIQQNIDSLLTETSESIEKEKQKVKDYVVKYMVIHLYFLGNKKMKDIANIYGLKVKEVSKIIEEYKAKYLK